jgi:dTDP-4-dehydrorhamnose 3,5-epimerase
MAMIDGRLPAGVVVHRLESHPDDRGAFLELWREEWGIARPMPQWNAVRSDARVLRGVHVHRRHDDYLTLPVGRAVIGLCDLRPASATSRAAATVALDDTDPHALVIPHGVAHGFLFLAPSLHCYAVSHTFDPTDELGCRYDDPELGISWPAGDVRLSPRDRDLPSLAALQRQLSSDTPEPSVPA